MRRPGSMPCDLIRMVAAASPITPGSVQPGKGTTRSCAPVAAISRGAVKALWPSWPEASTRKPLATDQTRQPKRSVIADCGNAGAEQVVALRASASSVSARPPARRAIDLSACSGGLVDQQHRQAVPRSRKRGLGSRPARRRSRSDRTPNSFGSPRSSPPHSPPRPARCRIGAARRRSTSGIPGTRP